MLNRCALCGVQRPHLCADCSNSQFELMRTGCAQCERDTRAVRLEVNRVFKELQRLQAAVSAGEENEESGDVPGHTASMRAIKVLAQQLVKLETVNDKVRTIGMERTVEAIRKRNARAALQLEQYRKQVADERESIKLGAARLQADTGRQREQLQREYEFEALKTARVKRQVLHQQRLHYNVLVQASFGYTGASLVSRLKGRRLLLCHQPIINIESFFEYNNKLEQLNTFLENVIVLQRRLTRVFDAELALAPLPYLHELELLLPDKKFFRLVREREAQILGDERPATADAEPQASEDKTEVILGDAFKLPLSSKTINNQRRQSIQRGELEAREEEPQTDATGDADPAPKLAPGKKVVIIPHKIITKPFTKLTPKELIKFLQIIVRILANFRVILARTQPLAEIYSFSAILEHLANMDTYFELQLQRVEQSKHEPMTGLVETLSLTTGSSLLRTRGSIKTFYSRIFGLSRADALRIGGIFGDISEVREREVDHEPAPPSKHPKVTMQKVYQTMVAGGRDKTMSTRGYLKDWDVISKMM